MMSTQSPEQPRPELLPEAPPTPKQRSHPKPKPEPGMPPPDETPGSTTNVRWSVRSV